MTPETDPVVLDECTAETLEVAPVEAQTGHLHALLLNGGYNPKNNNLSHVEHLQGMLEVLAEIGVPAQQISVFSSDGEDEDADLVLRAADDEPRAYLLEGTQSGDKLAPQMQLVDTKWPEVEAFPARKRVLRQWFEDAATRLQSGDTLLVYVTDHGMEGKKDPDNGSIALWHDSLYVDDMRDMLALLPADVRVVMVMSQCFSGTFAAAVIDNQTLTIHDDIAADVCGMFAVPRDRPAFGCYPEGKAGGTLGHGYVFIDALTEAGDLNHAHMSTLFDDDTPDIPVRTSDLLAERYVRARGERATEGFVDWVDGQLSEVWESNGAWDEERDTIEALAQAYGIATPHTLLEIDVLQVRLEDQQKAFARAEQRWAGVASNVAAENLEQFFMAEPSWLGRLKRVDDMEPAERKAVRSELLEALERYTGTRGTVLQDLEFMTDQALASKDGHWRTQVRRAVVERMRMLLLRMAAEKLLDAEGGVTAEAFEQLTACERAPLRQSLGGAVPEISMSSMDAEAELLAQVAPNRLGIAYDGASEDAGGVVVVDDVASGTAAARAGLQAGDVVVGPPDAPFEASIDIARWVLVVPAGQPLTLDIIRAGKAKQVVVEL